MHILHDDDHREFDRHIQPQSHFQQGETTKDTTVDLVNAPSCSGCPVRHSMHTAVHGLRNGAWCNFLSRSDLFTNTLYYTIPRKCFVRRSSHSKVILSECGRTAVGKEECMFQVLAISVDDAFLMVHAWNRIERCHHKSTQTRAEKIAQVRRSVQGLAARSDAQKPALLL